MIKPFSLAALPLAAAVTAVLPAPAGAQLFGRRLIHQPQREIPPYRGGDAAMQAGSWEIGPIINGRNYSRGMPLSPAPGPRGWSFDFPTRPDAHVHYLTFRHGSLAGKRRIVMRYRIDAARGVRFVQQEAPGGPPASVSLYFQRGGDSWTARGRYGAYRWYYAARTTMLAPGIYEISAPLNGNWTAVTAGDARQLPDAFADALAGADRVGFTFGGSNGLGHGVYATGPARFTLLSFRVE